MKKHIQSWLVTFAVIFAGSLGLHACSDDDAILNLITLDLGAYGNTIGAHSTAAQSACEGQCDGNIPDYGVDLSFYNVDSGDTFSILVDGDPNSPYMVTADAESTSATIDQALVDLVNGTSTVVRADVLSSVGVYRLDDISGGIDITSSTSGGGTESLPPPPANDTVALFALIFEAIIIPEVPDLISEAEMADELELEMGERVSGTIAATIGYDCENTGGRVLVATSFSGTLENPMGTIQPDEDVSSVMSTTITYLNCQVSGDLLDDGLVPALVPGDPGSEDEVLTLNGSASVSEVVRTVVDEYYLLDEIADVNLSIATDGGHDDDSPFWTDSMQGRSYRYREWDLTMGGPPLVDSRVDGGMCLGAPLAADADNTVDTDDDCADGGDRFIPATAVLDMFTSTK